MAVRARLKNIFGPSFWFIASITALSGVACYLVRGREAFLSSFKNDLQLVGLITPRLGAALLIAAAIQVLLPRDKVARWLGEQAGLKAMLIAAAAGMVTPGGPMTSFPVVNALHEAGTGRRALVTYLTSWSTQGFQRILMWELPMMGTEFAVFRFLVSLPLPIVAGMIARYVPIDSDPPPAEAE